MELLSSPSFALFVIISLGFILGKLCIKGISLDISAVIFVALIFGHYGVTIPHAFEKLGLVLFLFTIGLQAGPGFFEAFAKKGRSLIGLAFVLVLSGGLVTWLMARIYDLNPDMAAGLFTGALTSTPGLAAAIDVTRSPDASIGYGIAYPVGVIGVIVFVRCLPRMIRADIPAAEQAFKEQIQFKHPEVFSANFIVDNEGVIGKSIGQLKVRHMTDAVISRLMHASHVISPTPKSVFKHGDIIRAVGTKAALGRVECLFGPKTCKEIPLDEKFDVRSVLVTNPKAVNMTIAAMNLHANYGANITRIRRSGIDLVPSPQTRIKFGDKLILVCSKENMRQVATFFGNDNKKLSDTDFLPIALGIVLGILVGKLSISFGDFCFSPGLSGGVLLVAMVLGRVGKTGPILWTMTGAANNLLRQLGLLFFLAAVGTTAGRNIMPTIAEYGFSLLIVGAVITFVPMIAGVVYARYIAKEDILTLLGGLTGAMTSTPGLAAIDPMTTTNAPAIAYATVYPVAMVFVIITVQLLGVL